MKQFLKKPLGLAVAATLAIGGMAVYTNASAGTNANALGDLALVPYYTVRGNYATGVHVTNTSDATQVVKFRLRRGSDSADALDFNVILSPYDMWVGTINDSGGQLGIATSDLSCTAPVANGTNAAGKPKFIAPATFAANGAADEGYLEIIPMGRAEADQPISIGALHTGGVPADCDAVRANFLASNVLSNNFTRASGATTYATAAANTPADNIAADVSEYTNTGNVLKVSYFIRDLVTGMEMGDNATHITDFANIPMMTNQQAGLNSGDLDGFDFPDLDGSGLNVGGVGVGSNRNRYDTIVRDPIEGLGATSILNDWSYKASNGVSTDWVVTIPGQYLMDDPSDNGSIIVDGQLDLIANHRDIPVTATFNVYDREEGTATPGGLVISPSPQDASTTLSREVNVIEWGGQSVFGTVAPTTITPNLASGNTTGWANLAIETNTPTSELAIFDQTDVSGATYTGEVGGVVGPNGAIQSVLTPVIGFTGWQRTFEDASKNYGRIVAHSRVVPVP